MRDGHVEQIGAPLDLYGFPDNIYWLAVNEFD